jgi:hypothetical protein
MKAPKLPTLFKAGRQEPKRFSYRPRIYDERRERLEKRKKEIEEELKFEQRVKENPDVQRLEYERDNYLRFERKRQSRQSNIRLVIILAVLIFGTLLLLRRIEILGAADKIF